MKHLLRITICTLALWSPASGQSSQDVDEKAAITGSAVDAANDFLLIRDASVATGPALKKLTIGDVINVPGFFGSVSATELGYLDGVTSAIQTQINGKLGTSATAADVNPAGTSIAAALAGKQATIADGALSLAKLATDPLARVNHTGTQALSTLSQSGATANQVPKWNGSAWAAADDMSGTVNNAAVNAAILTAPETTRNVLLQNSRQLVKVMNTFGNALRQGWNPLVRIAIMGDSTRRDVALPFWYGKFGVSGKICTTVDTTEGYIALAGGAAATDDNNLYSTAWTGCDYWTVPSAGTVTYNDARYQTNQFELWYFAEDQTAGGVVEYDIDGAGSWNTVYTNGTINVDNNTAGLTLTKVTGIIENSGGQGFSKNYRVRFRSTSGTPKIAAIGAFLQGGQSNGTTRPSGVVSFDMGKGGQFVANTASVPSANFSAQFTGFAPDVVFFRMWEAHFGSGYQTDFDTVMDRIKAAVPTAAIVVIGRHPTSDIPDPFEVTAIESWIRDYCLTNDISFISPTRFFPDAAEMLTLTMIGDEAVDVHLTTLGKSYLDEIIKSQIPLLDGATCNLWVGPTGTQPTTPWLNGVAGVNGPEGLFTVGGFSSNNFGYMGLASGTGNAAGSYGIKTGIGRLKTVAGYQHAGRLGLYNEGTLTGIIGDGRLWVGPGTSSTGNPGRESGIGKQIGAAITGQAPAVGVPAGMFGAIASQTGNIVSFNTGMSVSTDGTTVSGINKDGIYYHTPVAHTATTAAIPVTSQTNALTTTAPAQAITLADGIAGQVKTIMHVATSGGGTAVLTPATKTGYTTITFTNVGDTVTLKFYTTYGWMIESIRGAVAA